MQVAGAGAPPSRVRHWGIGGVQIVNYLGAKFFADGTSRIGSELLHGQYDAANFAVIRSLVRTGSVCVDAGANVGVYTTILSHLSGPTGHVHSFEPVAHLRRRIEAHLALNCVDNVTLNALALGDKPGTLPMHQVKEGVYRAGTSSFLQTEAQDAVGRDAFEAVPTAVTTLDRYAAEKSLQRLDFIKLDVEGYERFFFQGAEECLSRFSPTILFEHSRDRLQSLNIDEAYFRDLFMRHGYRIYEFRERMSLVWFSPFEIGGGQMGKRNLLARNRSSPLRRLMRAPSQTRARSVPS